MILLLTLRHDLWRRTEVIKTIPRKATVVAETSITNAKVVSWLSFISLRVPTVWQSGTVSDLFMYYTRRTDNNLRCLIRRFWYCLCVDAWEDTSETHTTRELVIFGWQFMVIVKAARPTYLTVISVTRVVVTATTLNVCLYHAILLLIVRNVM